MIYSTGAVFSARSNSCLSVCTLHNLLIEKESRQCPVHIMAWVEPWYGFIWKRSEWHISFQDTLCRIISGSTPMAFISGLHTKFLKWKNKTKRNSILGISLSIFDPFAILFFHFVKITPQNSWQLRSGWLYNLSKSVFHRSSISLKSSEACLRPMRLSLLHLSSS